MGIIKLALISLLVFALIITGFSLFFPSRVRISKAIDIRNKREAVMQQIRQAENWKKWFPGADTAILFTADGAITGIGLSNDQKLLISGTTDSSVTATYTGRRTRAISGWNLIGNDESGFITVQWYMDFRLRWYPWEKFSSMLLEKRVGPVMEQGLENLKQLLEN